MNCREIREVLSPYLDGELSPSEAAEVTVHLGACEICRGELQALRLTSRLAASLPARRLKMDLAETVVAQASQSTWLDRLSALRDLVAPPGRFLVREYGRAIAVVALFMLAAAGRGQGPGDFVISWPGRVAGAAGTAVATLTAGLADAQVILTTQSLPAPSKPPVQPTRERRPKAARPPSALITLSIEEAHSNVRV